MRPKSMWNVTVALFALAAVFAVLLVDSLAYGQAAVEPVATSAPTLGAVLLQYLLIPVLSALALILTGAAGAFAVYLKNKAAEAGTDTKARVAEVVGSKAMSLMANIVKGLWTEMREKMEAASADGELSADEKEKLKSEAIARFLAVASDALKSELFSGLGLAPSALPTFAAGLVETSVGGLKTIAAEDRARRMAAEAKQAEAKRTTTLADKTTAELLRLAAGDPASK